MDDDGDYETLRQFEDEIYREEEGVKDDNGDVDSDVEDAILSHVYYKVAVNQPKSSPQQISNAAALEDLAVIADGNEESKYTVSKRQMAKDKAFTSDTSELLSSDSEDEYLYGAPDGTNLSKDPSTSFMQDTIPQNVDEGLLSEELITHVIDPLANVDVQGDTMFSRDTDDYDYLDDEEFTGKNRYFMDPDANQSKMLCNNCNQPGHFARDCTEKKTCMKCGSREHETRFCTIDIICFNCGLKGHQNRDCPNPRGMRTICKLCGSTQHHSDECHYIWRTYVFHSKPIHTTVRKWCFNCGKEGHWGDNCSERRFSSGPTAFSAQNADRGQNGNFLLGLNNSHDEHHRDRPFRFEIDNHHNDKMGSRGQRGSREERYAREYEREHSPDRKRPRRSPSADQYQVDYHSNERSRTRKSSNSATMQHTNGSKSASDRFTLNGHSSSRDGSKHRQLSDHGHRNIKISRSNDYPSEQRPSSHRRSSSSNSQSGFGGGPTGKFTFEKSPGPGVHLLSNAKDNYSNFPRGPKYRGGYGEKRR